VFFGSLRAFADPMGVITPEYNPSNRRYPELVVSNSVDAITNSLCAFIGVRVKSLAFIDSNVFGIAM